jgi:hypothetical protein
MSILRKLASVFNRNGHDTLTVDAAPSEDQAPRQVPAPSENAIYVYSHGFTNGVYRVEPEKDHFEEFLLASTESEKISEQRKRNHVRLLETRQLMALKQSAFERLQDVFIERGKSVEHLSARIHEIDDIKQVRQDKQKHLTEVRNATHAEYAWVPALLFLAAGVVFIVGDISITHQITSWGFDMKGIEGWVFAVGLAFTAFLIKPVVDRLLEKRFQKTGQQLTNVYKAVLLIITGLGIVMLFLLGKFRSESQVAATKLGDINYQMQSLSDPNSAEYIKLAEERKLINEDLTNNPVGEWGIILSGIIFAIGGALCLSIAFPSLSQLINRYWILPLKISALRRQINNLDAQRTEIKNELKVVTGDILKAEHQLKGFDFDKINEEIRELETEEKQLLVEYYEKQFQKEKNLYQDGKSRGEKYNIDGDLLYRALENDPTDLFHKNGKSATSDAANKTPRRPFVKIRKMIADNYNKHQNNNSPDGTEFEIVS